MTRDAKANSADAQPEASQARPVSRMSAIPRYMSAVFSQGLVSGFHFILNLTLVRLLSLEDFGVYALAFVLAIITSSVSNALVATPLSVYGPAATNAEEQSNIESVLGSFMMFLLGGLLGLGLLATSATSLFNGQTQTLMAGLVFVLAYLGRQYTRSFGYSRFDITSVLIADVVYVSAGAILILARTFSTSSLGVVDVLLILALANLVATLFELSRLLPVSRWSLDFLKTRFDDVTDAYAPIWQKSQWALIGAVTTVIVSQAHSIIVTLAKGPAAYAPLAAGFVIFGPVRVIFTTIQNVIKPEMSRAIASGNAAGALRQTILASSISLIAVSFLVLATWLAWPLLDQWLYAEKYADAPMRSIVFLWAGITLISAAQNGPFAALQSLKEFRQLALATVYGSILSLVLVALTLAFYPVHYSIVGIMAAELFVVIWVVRLASDSFGSRISSPRLA